MTSPCGSYENTSPWTIGKRMAVLAYYLQDIADQLDFENRAELIVDLYQQTVGPYDEKYGREAAMLLVEPLGAPLPVLDWTDGAAMNGAFLMNALYLLAADQEGGGKGSVPARISYVPLTSYPPDFIGDSTELGSNPDYVLKVGDGIYADIVLDNNPYRDIGIIIQTDPGMQTVDALFGFGMGTFSNTKRYRLNLTGPVGSSKYKPTPGALDVREARISPNNHNHAPYKEPLPDPDKIVDAPELRALVLACQAGRDKAAGIAPEKKPEGWSTGAKVAAGVALLGGAALAVRALSK